VANTVDPHQQKKCGSNRIK